MRESIVYPATFRESRLRHLLGAYSTLSSSSHNCLSSCELSYCGLSDTSLFYHQR